MDILVQVAAGVSEDSEFSRLVCRNAVSCPHHFLTNQVFITSQLPKVCSLCQTQIFKSSSALNHFSSHGFLPPNLFVGLLLVVSLFPICLKKLLFPLISWALFDRVSSFANLISLLGFQPSGVCTSTVYWQHIF